LVIKYENQTEKNDLNTWKATDKYAVNRKKGGSTFLTITLESLDGF